MLLSVSCGRRVVSTFRSQLQSTVTLQSRRHISIPNKFFCVAEEVQDALSTGKPVVALESTIYTHGFPYPENVALSSHLESIVRVNGGVPATIGFLDGIAHVGMDTDQLIRLVSSAGSADTWKISRRDIGLIAGLGLRGRKLHGGTTISGTMILAHLAGIKIFATGGLGGVHRGGENTMDISADLTELGRTPVAVIASGCKSFLDLERTLEYLETQGVGVATFADGRKGDVDFPAFFSRDSGVKSPQTIQSEADAAAVVHAQFQLGVQSGLLFASPVPEQVAMTRDEIDSIIERAIQEADERGIRGSENTPYILKRIRELSHGGSVAANRGLIEANVKRGTKVAVELARLETGDYSAANGSIQVPTSFLQKGTTDQGEVNINVIPSQETDLLVIGSLAADTSCDFDPLEGSKAEIQPVLNTSNPALISQSVGGVGRNVATAAQYAGVQVALASAIADDFAGGMLKERLAADNIDTTTIRTLPTSVGARTAQYMAVNDVKKDLVLAMGDFSIFTRPEFEEPQYWVDLITSRNPKWIVLDGNWSSSITAAILDAARQAKTPVAFEPVSTAKSARVFNSTNTTMTTSSVLPNHLISLTTPNRLELAAMHTAAQTRGLFDSDDWWQCINRFSLPSSGSRDRFVALSNAQLVDNGVPQQAVQLLPYIPNIITKLGADGCFLTSVLARDDARLTDPKHAPYILSRNLDDDESPIGGIFMRLFPPAEVVGQHQVVSVNGVGDTLLGVLMSRLIQELKVARHPRLDEIIPVAQQAAVMTLKSPESVSPRLKELRKV